MNLILKIKEYFKTEQLQPQPQLQLQISKIGKQVIDDLNKYENWKFFDGQFGNENVKYVLSVVYPIFVVIYTPNQLIEFNELESSLITKKLRLICQNQKKEEKKLKEKLKEEEINQLFGFGPLEHRLETIKEEAEERIKQIVKEGK